jgi:iron complex transport system permease protein
VIAALGGALVFLFVASFVLGRFAIAPMDVVRILASPLWPSTPTWTPAVETVVLSVRLPRIMAAVLVGGSLAAGGAAYQTLFRNPLVSPTLLGVSAGAALGATAAMLFSLSRPAVQGAAFVCGLAAVSSTLFVASRFRSDSPTVLVLAGLVMSAFFEALVSFVKYVADPIDKLPAITFWLLGGLAKANNQDVAFAAIPILGAFAALYVARWSITVAGLGDDEALALGVQPRRIRLGVIVATTLMTAPAVSIAGIVGWIGLLVPHAARLLVGPRFQWLLPVSFLLGSAFLLLIDNLVRSLPSELPLGAVTAIVGAPCFILLMLRLRVAWR